MIFEIKTIDGTPCPKCGCRNVDEIQAQGFSLTGAFLAFLGGAGKPIVLQCRHCDTVFPDYVEKKEKKEEKKEYDGEAVAFVRTKCPFCGSSDTKVTSTTKPKRRHKCQKCKKNFKSLE